MRSLYKKKHYAPDKAVYTTKTELYYYLHFLDTNPVIQEFLRHDTSFRLADKYLIAMVFIYFKRAQLSPEDYTKLNFFAGLCLAHSMEEDVELSSEIYPWALGNALKDELPRLLELKVLLWVAMDYRAAVSRHCCKQKIECQTIVVHLEEPHSILDTTDPISRVSSEFLINGFADYNQYYFSCSPEEKRVLIKLISISANHPVWRRERSPLHSAPF